MWRSHSENRLGLENAQSELDPLALFLCEQCVFGLQFFFSVIFCNDNSDRKVEEEEVADDYH
jgi:hypothetical protein